MTILDLINKSAIMLNIQEVLNDVDVSNITIYSEPQVLESNFALNRLYQFAKIVVNEINSYQPTIKEVELNSTDKQIAFDQLENMSKIISVKNEYGFIKCKFSDSHIRFEQDGKYTIAYAQAIKINSVFDEIALNVDEIGEDMFIAGVNAYYCLATGLFQEFNVYNTNYINKLGRLKNLKLFAMPCRSWE